MVSIKDIKFICPVLFYMAIAKGFTHAKDFLKPSLSFEQLDKVAYRVSDNKSADQLNLAKKRLFKPINEQKKG
jgi:hypothetical protein